MMPNGLQIEKIKELMLSAGRLILSAGGIGRDDMQISDKAGRENFVTKYDIAVQGMLVEGISSIIPNCTFLAEEDASYVHADKGSCFVIDPIDGTTNFIHGMNESSISVGMLYDSQPVFGAVYDPYADEMFIAERGSGAFLNGKRIYVSDAAFEHAIVMVGTSPYYKDTLGERTAELMKRFLLSCGDIRRGGSAAIDLCRVACGRADLFCEVRLSPWDFTAASVIIGEAGGKITDMNGNELIPAVQSSVFASNGKCHKQGIELINT